MSDIYANNLCIFIVCVLCVCSVIQVPRGVLGDVGLDDDHHLNLLNNPNYNNPIKNKNKQSSNTSKPSSLASPTSSPSKHLSTSNNTSNDINTPVTSENQSTNIPPIVDMRLPSVFYSPIPPLPFETLASEGAATTYMNARLTQSELDIDYEFRAQGIKQLEESSNNNPNSPINTLYISPSSTLSSSQVIPKYPGAGVGSENVYSGNNTIQSRDVHHVAHVVEKAGTECFYTLSNIPSLSSHWRRLKPRMNPSLDHYGFKKIPTLSQIPSEAESNPLFAGTVAMTRRAARAKLREAVAGAGNAADAGGFADTFNLSQAIPVVEVEEEEEKDAYDASHNFQPITPTLQAAADLFSRDPEADTKEIENNSKPGGGAGASSGSKKGGKAGGKGKGNEVQGNGPTGWRESVLILPRRKESVVTMETQWTDKREIAFGQLNRAIRTVNNVIVEPKLLVPMLTTV